jgi:hypothetical protein
MTGADWAGYELSADEGRIVDAIAVLEADRPADVPRRHRRGGRPAAGDGPLAAARLLRQTNLIHEVVPEAGPYYEIAPKD